MRTKSISVIATAAVLISACGGAATPANVTSVSTTAPISVSTSTSVSPTNLTTQLPEPTAAPITTPQTTTADTASPGGPFTGVKAWIAYQSNKGGAEGVWLIHPDGTGDHQVAAAQVPGEEKYGNWSPDGRRLVFTTRTGGAAEPLYEYDLATDTSRQLFDCSDPCVGDDEPVYSPDGSEVAFSRAIGPLVDSPEYGGQVPTDCGLWIGDVATRKVRQITSNTHPACDREYFPTWSPDGARLAYWRDPYDAGKPSGTGAFVINVDGTNEVRLSDPATPAGDPDWSPDGQWIVFSSYPLSEYNFVPVKSDLFRIRPDGTQLEQLTHFDSEQLRATIPRYTPNGKWILFTAVLPDSRAIWAIPAEGGDPVVITKNGTRVHAVWQPNSE